jgi:hypothetical protein
MKTQFFQETATLMIMLGLSLGFTQCSEGSGMDDITATDNASLKPTIADLLLSQEEINAIRFMRKEEKLARDVYLQLYDLFSLRPFLNISKSEQAHMDAILYLINIYGLDDPAGENPEGVFQNQELQQMYDELIETGSASREEALKVGALIEEVDIIDLRTHLEENVESDEMIRVFTNLCNPSERHLKAFVRILKAYGVDYTPVKLEQEEFNRIVAG